MTGIYAIRNLVNGKLYVGSARRLSQREAQHFRHLALGTHHSIKLQRAWAKYSSAAFVFEVLEEIHDESQLLPLEQKWLDHFQAATHRGYNVSPTAGSLAGVPCSPQARVKLSLAMKGRRHTPEALAKMRGYVRSPEVCARMGASKRGLKRSPASRARISAAKKGQGHTQETRAKIAAKLSGIVRSSETRARMAIAQRGIPCPLKRSKKSVAAAVVTRGC